MALTNKVGLDTNMLTAIFEFKIDVFEQIRNILGNVAFVVPNQVMDELDSLSKRNNRLKHSCRIATEAMEKNRVRKIEVKARDADSALLKLSERMPIATNDKVLRSKIKKKGGKVLILRQRKYIEFA